MFWEFKSGLSVRKLFDMGRKRRKVRVRLRIAAKTFLRRLNIVLRAFRESAIRRFDCIQALTDLSVRQAALRQGLVDEFLRLSGGEGLCDGAHRHLAVDRRRHPQALPVLLQIRLGTHVVHLDVVGQPAKAIEPSLKNTQSGN